MEKIILKKFGAGTNILVLIPNSSNTTFYDDEDAQNIVSVSGKRNIAYLKYERGCENNAITKIQEAIMKTFTFGKIKRFSRIDKMTLQFFFVLRIHLSSTFQFSTALFKIINPIRH